MNAASHGCRRYLHFQRFAFSRSQQSGVYFLKHQFRSRPFSTAEVFGRFQRPVRSVSSASPRYGPKILLCALSPLVFVEISEHEEQDGRTAKEQMLDASTEEAKNRVPDFLQTSGKLRRSLYLYVDHYIIEPFMTGVRFLHLVVLFIPVILSVPAIYLGERQPQRSNERSGSIWWYGYLVWSMEKAGAAYIKVPCRLPSRLVQSSILTLRLARAMGCFTNRYISYGNV